MLENIVWAPRYSLSMLEKWLRTVSLSDEFRPISDGFRLWIKTGSSQTALILLWVAGHTMYSTGMKYRTHWNHQIRALTRNRPKPDIIPPLLGYWDHHTHIYSVFVDHLWEFQTVYCNSIQKVLKIELFQLYCNWRRRSKTQQFDFLNFFFSKSWNPHQIVNEHSIDT